MRAEGPPSSRTSRAASTSGRNKPSIEAPKLDWQSIWDFLEAPDTEDGEWEPSRNSVTYSSIKRMILAGQLGPGRKLVHEDLAQALNVSRTPVREALERLYQEGFVTRLPRRGFYVTGITRDEAFGLYGAREALELYALQITLERGPIPKGALNTISAYARRYEGFIKDQVLTERILADVLLHLKLAELSGNRYVVRILAQTFERLALKRRHEGYRYDRSQRAASEHAQLLDALARHDKRAALQTLQKHILSARDALLSQLYELPDFPFEKR
jgi:GntR family transcriptional regulator, rspAB operon transcriptional repressor